MGTENSAKIVISDFTKERSTNPEAVNWHNIKRSWQAYALLFPFLLLLVIFVYYPPLLGLFRAFYNWNPLTEPVFIGFQNFIRYFQDPGTIGQLVNMSKLLYMGLFIGVVVPFIMAEMIFSIRSKGTKEVYRMLVVIPMLVPGVVFTLLWGHIYDPQLGPINALLDSIGLKALALNWLGDPTTALYAIIFVGFPWVASTNTLIYLGGLAQIPESYFDASLIDGCTGLHRIIQIDLPLVLGQVRLLTILAGISGLTSFNSILILTNGGPGFSTYVPGFFMYEKAFISGEFGYASAVGFLLFILAMGLTLLVNKVIKPVS